MRTSRELALLRVRCDPGKLAKHLAEHLDATLIQDTVFFYDLQLFRDAELAESPCRDAGAHHGPDLIEGGRDLFWSLVHVDLHEVEVVEARALDGARKVLHARAPPSHDCD